jgi:hypothetical protein
MRRDKLKKTFIRFALVFSLITSLLLTVNIIKPLEGFWVDTALSKAFRTISISMYFEKL